MSNQFNQIFFEYLEDMREQGLRAKQEEVVEETISVGGQSMTLGEYDHLASDVLSAEEMEDYE